MGFFVCILTFSDYTVFMSEVTQLLKAMDAGDSEAVGQLFPLVYDKLREVAAYHMSREAKDHTLQPTALVNEVYVKLFRTQDGQGLTFNNRRHFFLTASESMRRILIDHARTKGRAKRGGEKKKLPLEDVAESLADPEELLIVDELLAKFALKYPRRCELVKLRVFAGCTIPECAELCGISPSTAEDDWAFARAWLGREWLKSEKDAE